MKVRKANFKCVRFSALCLASLPLRSAAVKPDAFKYFSKALTVDEHGENDFVASTKHLFNMASANQIAKVTRALITATTVNIVVTMRAVVTKKIVTTILVC